MDDISFSDIIIISCGILSPELNYLRETELFDAQHVVCTPPGLHERPKELERQLTQKVNIAKEKSDKVIVVYGGKFCYVNADKPTRTLDSMLDELGTNVKRIQATHCLDALASEEERERIAREMAGGEKIWWMSPGWVKFRHQVFKDWDKELAEEKFSSYTGGAVVLDAIGFMEKYKKDHPEELMEYSDWMGIPIKNYPITLDRLKSLLRDQAIALQ